MHQLSLSYTEGAKENKRVNIDANKMIITFGYNGYMLRNTFTLAVKVHNSLFIYIIWLVYLPNAAWKHAWCSRKTVFGHFRIENTKVLSESVNLLPSSQIHGSCDFSADIIDGSILTIQNGLFEAFDSRKNVF